MIHYVIYYVIHYEIPFVIHGYTASLDWQHFRTSSRRLEPTKKHLTYFFTTNYFFTSTGRTWPSSSSRGRTPAPSTSTSGSKKVSNLLSKTKKFLLFLLFKLSRTALLQRSFLKVAITLVDLLFIELMSHLSHVKQMYTQRIHLTRELILFIQIARGRVDFNGDSAEKSPRGLQVLSLWPLDPDLLWLK